MVRALSMMGSGILGAKTILVATMDLLWSARLGLGRQQHVGGTAHGNETARRIADAGLAEGDGATAAEQASFGEEVAVARRREKAHVEIKGALAHAAPRPFVGGADGTAHGHVHERAQHAAVHGGAHGVAEAVLDGDAQLDPALPGILDVHLEMPPEEVLLGAVAGEGEGIGRHGWRARLYRKCGRDSTLPPEMLCSPLRVRGARNPRSAGGDMATRIGIIGAGAIGSVVGGMLTRAGHDVTLIDQWPDHIEAIKRHGLRLSGTCGEHLVPVKAMHIHETQGLRDPFDVIFISVKSYDTEWATALATVYLRQPSGIVVDFQNGINDERVAAVAGRERTLGCVITISAGLYEPGHATRTDTGLVGFKVGEHDGADSARARDLARILNEVAPSTVTTNLWGERWSKLAVNCMANPLAGLSGLGSAEVRSEAAPRRIAIHLAAEVIRVGRALGHEIEPLFGLEAQRFVDAAAGRGLEEVEADMAAEAKRRSGGRPSFLQDVLKGRRTEIDYLNGYVSEQGRSVGVPTPFNDAAVAEVHRHGVGTLSPDPRNLEPLARMLPR